MAFSYVWKTHSLWNTPSVSIYKNLVLDVTHPNTTNLERTSVQIRSTRMCHIQYFFYYYFEMDVVSNIKKLCNIIDETCYCLLHTYCDHSSTEAYRPRSGMWKHRWAGKQNDQLQQLKYKEAWIRFKVHIFLPLGAFFSTQFGLLPLGLLRTHFSSHWTVWYMKKLYI